MGKFTNLVDGLLGRASDMVGDSVRLAKRTFGAAPTDEQADAAAAKVREAVAKVEAIAAAAIDEIPGVPTVVAKLAAHAFATILTAAVAGATQAVKDNN